MGRKKRPNSQQNAQQQGNPNDPKKARAVNETGESYLVKKYRPTKIYAAMEAFVKYTKSHRMLDASYVRWKTGVTPEKPFVFSTRVGGVDLGWGRGKTREAAMDCGCRAAFALVAAHGYNNFPLDEDCLMQAPMDPLPPPPPPPINPPGMHHPPLPPGLPPGSLGHHGMPPHHLPPLPNGLPPLPHGVPPGLPPGLPPPPPGQPPPLPSADLIPQAKMVSNAAPTASSLSSTLGTPSSSVLTTSTTQQSLSETATAGNLHPVSMSLNANQGSSSSDVNKTRKNDKGKKMLKGGLTLVYAPDGEAADEFSMEEMRALLPRYQKFLSQVPSIHKASM